MSQDFENLSIRKKYLYPSLALFLVPVFSLFYFNHAQSRFDRLVLESIEQNIEQDTTMSAEQRADSLKFFRNVPMSRILKSSAPELRDLQESLGRETRFHYATFDWMIRLAFLSIVAGILVFVVTGVSVVFSKRSQRAQYLSLLVGWHVLRSFSTFQVIAQGLLVLALSFWITALWFNFYSIRLMLVAFVVAAASVVPVLKAIFKRVDDQFVVEGQVLDKESARELWDDLARLATAVGTNLPNQIIAGVDDNFFVTEQRVTVKRKIYSGRTLFVSLALLKVLHGREAAAVMVHELAHFSGNDTLFSKRISPLLVRYQNYLEGLYEGFLSRPVFYCAILFRELYQISLGTLSRQREFRADRIAAENTSPRDVATALLRITAYSEYRRSIEKELFDAQQAHATANISERIELGFQEFSARFAEIHDAGKLSTAHPFDSHPPLSQRLEALSYSATTESMQSLLAAPADGAWFHHIHGAESIEKAQWSDYEEEFRQVHENVLAFRYLPSTDEERALVVRYFPAIKLPTYQGGTVIFDCEKIIFDEWDEPVYYSEIKSVVAETDFGKPQLSFRLSSDRGACELPLSKQPEDQKELFEILEKYSGRYAAAEAYQESLQSPKENEESQSESS